MLAQQGDHRAIRVPYSVLDRRGRDLSDSLLLLNIEQDDGRRRAQQETCGPTIEDLVGLNRWLDGLGYRVGQVSDLDIL